MAWYRTLLFLTQIIDDEHVPQAVREERPASKNPLHTIRFFPAAD